MASRGSLILLYSRFFPAIRPESGPSSLQSLPSKVHHLPLAACLLAIILMAMAATTALAADQPPARVAVTKVFEKEVAPTASLVGNVVFDQSAGISPEVSGLIADHRMIEGTVVRNGDVLVR
jgi:multidrug efflux pump subunit AcrA (membrane-fusion protein)